MEIHDHGAVVGEMRIIDTFDEQLRQGCEATDDHGLKRRSRKVESSIQERRLRSGVFQRGFPGSICQLGLNDSEPSNGILERNILGTGGIL